MEENTKNKGTNGSESQAGDREKCTVVNREEIIDRYLEDRLSQAEVEEFEDHYFGCAACFETLRFKREMISAIQAKASANQPAEGLERSSLPLDAARLLPKRELKARRWYFYAVAALLFVGLWAGYLKFRQSNEEESHKLFWANAQPSPHFENLVNAFTRAPAVKVLSPENGSNVTEEIRFRWEGQARGQISLKIIDRKEKEQLSFTPQENQVFVSEMDSKLPPGLYYWKLETEDRLIYVGKFFIHRPPGPGPP